MKHRFKAILLPCFLLLAFSCAAEPATNYYRVQVLGENYLINMNGKVRKLGFMSTRQVIADTQEEAELLAIRLVKLDLRGKILNQANDPPQISAEQTFEVAMFFDQIDSAQLGLVWFPM